MSASGHVARGDSTIPILHARLTRNWQSEKADGRFGYDQSGRPRVYQSAQLRSSDLILRDVTGFRARNVIVVCQFNFDRKTPHCAVPGDDHTYSSRHRTAIMATVYYMWLASKRLI